MILDSIKGGGGLPISGPAATTYRPARTRAPWIAQMCVHWESGMEKVSQEKILLKNRVVREYNAQTISDGSRQIVRLKMSMSISYCDGSRYPKGRFFHR